MEEPHLHPRPRPRPPQAPLLFTGTPASILEEASRAIAHSRQIQRQLIEDIAPDAASFANVILPLAQANNRLMSCARHLVFYRSVSPDPEVQGASIQAKCLFDDFTLETAMFEKLFALVDAVGQKDPCLDEESRRFLTAIHKEHLSNGLKLSVGRRDRFKEIRACINRVTADFRQNASASEVDGNTDGDGLWFSTDDLSGLSDEFLGRLEPGTGENEGKMYVSLSQMEAGPMRSSENGETRKKVSMALARRCKENIPLFKEAVLLRDEAARLLGYHSHAALRLEDRCARTPDTVITFLNSLRDRLRGQGMREYEVLRLLKKADMESRGKPFDGHLFQWDAPVYHMQIRKQSAVDSKKIAEYFPVQTTLSGMLTIVEHLFGLVFVELGSEERHRLSSSGNGKDMAWHEDVQIFSTWDDEEEGGGFLGYLYVDLFRRPRKHDHVSVFNLMPGFTREDGTRQYPSTAIVANIPKPEPGKPSLLRHGLVVTLFHELGHAVHDLVSRTAYARFHGSDGTPVDFGEMPSQLLENWCWTPEVLGVLGRHYSYLSAEYLAYWEDNSNGGPRPPERIPENVIEDLISLRRLNDGISSLGQVFRAVFDMQVHHPESRESIQALDFTALWNDLEHDIDPLDGPMDIGFDNQWGHGYSKFGHIMGEYDAGYYSYLFSEVYSADLSHTVFKADPMSAKEGRRYRYAVLEKGGSWDGVKILTEFLGRRPCNSSFSAELGLE